ncbi:MAG: hypothetical protein IV107_10545 [Paucibacter sp.]|nr:hypothetical protein [Roseateles sp.]
MHKQPKALTLLTALLLSALASACSSTGDGKDQDLDDDRTYVTGTRIPYKGAQPIKNLDKNDVRESIRQQDLSRNPASN